MSKTRVSNLAEKLGIETKEVLTRLKELGFDVKSGTSIVDDEAVARLTAARPDDTAPEEVRVTTTIVRRRARVTTTPVEPEAVAEPAPASVEPAPEKSAFAAEKKPAAEKTPEKQMKR